MTFFRPALIYGLLGFCVGFLFGAIREVVLIPFLGSAVGHWLEFFPLVASIIMIGIWTVRKWPPKNISIALLVGMLAVMILLIVESVFALIILGVPLPEYLASFNILDGQLFPLGLLIMALTPAIFVRLQK